MDYYAIGQRIRRVRKSKGWSQERLAELVGISVTHMSHIETGNTKLSLEVFNDITIALEARADELLFGFREIPREQAMDDILQVLGDCGTSDICVIYDVIKTVKCSLDKYINNSEESTP